jgi:site-specific recombinase XerD
LRHTGATWLGQSKVPLPYLQRILGHANITTTLIYAHPTDEYLKEAVQQLDNFIFN